MAQIATVDVKSKGAKGDGTTDDTAAFQSALYHDTSGRLRYIKIPDGDYRVNPYAKLKLKSNTKLEFSQNARLIAINTNQDISSMLDVVNVENIEIINPVIVGDRDTNTKITEGAGHGISCRGVKNLIIRGGNISKCFTDGIYLNGVENCLIESVTCDTNRRQGMSITSNIKNLLVRNSTFKNTNGVPPMMGIDIEPNYANDYLRNIRLENIYTENNGTSGIGINLNQMDNATSVVDIVIDQWTDVGSNNAFSCVKYAGTISEAGTIKVIDMKSINAKSAGINILGHKADGSAKISIVRPNVQNPNTSLGTNERSQNVGISINTETSGYPLGVVQGNVEIIEPYIDVEPGRILLRGIYIGFGNDYKKILIKNPVKINIGDTANLSANNTHNLIGFSQSGQAIVVDKYDVLSLSTQATTIRNYNSAFYSKYITTVTETTATLKEFQRWEVVEDFSVINTTTPIVVVILPSNTTFIDETGTTVTGRYTATNQTGAVLRFRKIKDNTFRVVKEIGTWVLSA